LPTLHRATISVKPRLADLNHDACHHARGDMRHVTPWACDAATCDGLYWAYAVEHRREMQPSVTACIESTQCICCSHVRRLV